MDLKVVAQDKAGNDVYEKDDYGSEDAAENNEDLDKLLAKDKITSYNPE